jgi:hypothetical protein
MTKQPSTRTQPENKQQVAAFRKAARQLGCEPDEKRFQDALRTVAKAKSPSGSKKPTPESGHDS